MIAQFALRLICGLSATWCLMPRREVTCGFFRIQMLVALGLSALAALAIWTSPTQGAETWLPPVALTGLAAAAGAAAYVGSVIWALARRRAGAIIAAVIGGLSMAAVLGSVPRGWTTSASSTALACGSELAAAWLLGGAVAAMLLGHWYLTAPMMKLGPLAVLTWFLIAAVVVRGLLAAVAFGFIPEAARSPTQSVWLVMRWTCGLLLPLGLTLLIPRVLRYRNTQSATGVLFAVVILVFIGETAAAVLARDLRWPL